MGGKSLLGPEHSDKVIPFAVKPPKDEAARRDQFDLELQWLRQMVRDGHMPNDVKAVFIALCDGEPRKGRG